MITGLRPARHDGGEESGEQAQKKEPPAEEVVVREKHVPRESAPKAPERELEDDGQGDPERADTEKLSGGARADPPDRRPGDHPDHRREQDAAELVCEKRAHVGLENPLANSAVADRRDEQHQPDEQAPDEDHRSGLLRGLRDPDGAWRLFGEGLRDAAQDQPLETSLAGVTDDRDVGAKEPHRPQDLVGGVRSPVEDAHVDLEVVRAELRREGVELGRHAVAVRSPRRAHSLREVEAVQRRRDGQHREEGHPFARGCEASDRPFCDAGAGRSVEGEQDVERARPLCAVARDQHGPGRVLEDPPHRSTESPVRISVLSLGPENDQIRVGVFGGGQDFGGGSADPDLPANLPARPLEPSRCIVEVGFRLLAEALLDHREGFPFLRVDLDFVRERGRALDDVQNVDAAFEARKPRDEVDRRAGPWGAVGGEEYPHDEVRAG